MSACSPPHDWLLNQQGQDVPYALSPPRPASRWQLLRASWNCKTSPEQQALHHAHNRQQCGSPTGFTAPGLGVDRVYESPCKPTSSPLKPVKWRPAPSSLSPSDKIQLYSSQLNELDAALGTSRYSASCDQQDGHMACRPAAGIPDVGSMQLGSFSTAATNPWTSLGGCCPPAATGRQLCHDASLLALGRAQQGSTAAAQRHHCRNPHTVYADNAGVRPSVAYSIGRDLGHPGEEQTLEAAAEQLLARVSAALKPPAADTKSSQHLVHTIASADDQASTCQSATLQRIMEGARLQLLEAEFQDRQQQLAQAVLGSTSDMPPTDVQIAHQQLCTVSSLEVQQPAQPAAEHLRDAAVQSAAQEQLEMQGRTRTQLNAALIGWRQAATMSAAAAVEAIRRCQYSRLRHVLLAWHKLVSMDDPVHAARAQWAAKVAMRFRTLRLLYTCLKAWQAFAEQAHKQAVAAAQAAQRLAWETQRENHMNQVAACFRATYLKHITIRGWVGVTELAKQQRLVGVQAGQRQAAISAFLAKFTSQQACCPAPATSQCLPHDTPLVEPISNPAPLSVSGAWQATALIPSVQPSVLQAQHTAQVARALGNKGSQAATLIRSSVTGVAMRARYGQHMVAGRQQVSQSVDKPLATAARAEQKKYSRLSFSQLALPMQDPEQQSRLLSMSRKSYAHRQSKGSVVGNLGSPSSQTRRASISGLTAQPNPALKHHEQQRVAAVQSCAEPDTTCISNQDNTSGMFTLLTAAQPPSAGPDAPVPCPAEPLNSSLQPPQDVGNGRHPAEHNDQQAPSATAADTLQVVGQPQQSVERASSSSVPAGSSARRCHKLPAAHRLNAGSKPGVPMCSDQPTLPCSIHAHDDEAARLLARVRAEEVKRKRVSQQALQHVTSELLQQAIWLAEMHYVRSLLLRCGLQPWLRLMGLRQVQARQAELHLQGQQLRQAWHCWRHRVVAQRWSMAVQQAAGIGRLRCACQAKQTRKAFRALQCWASATCMSRYRLVNAAFTCWRLLLSWSRLARRDAMLFHRAHKLRGVISGWQQAASALAGERLIESLSQEARVKQHLARSRSGQVLRAWHNLVCAAKREAHIAGKQAETWKKIRGWLAEMPKPSLPLPEPFQGLQAPPLAADLGLTEPDKSWAHGTLLEVCPDWHARQSSVRKEASESAVVRPGGELVGPECSVITTISASDAAVCRKPPQQPSSSQDAMSVRRARLQQYLASRPG